MMTTKAMKERAIETHLRHYRTYLVGIKNCQRQLDYISPSLVTRYDSNQAGSSFYISNNTERVALDRIESKRAIDLNEEIEQYKIITTNIWSAFEELKPQEKDFVEFRYFQCMTMKEVKHMLGYSEEKSVYRIRRHVLDKLLISLNNLFSLK